MMHGVTAAGKTSTSKALAKTLGLTRLSTCDLKTEMGMEGRTQGYEQRDKAYAELLRRLEGGLSEGKSFVLDGTFALSRWRQSVYDVCIRRQLHLCVVVCLCEDPEEIARRLAIRRSKTNQMPDDEADQIEYWCTEKKGLEPIDKDELKFGEHVQLLVVDTTRLRVLGNGIIPDEPSAGVQELVDVQTYGS